MKHEPRFVFDTNVLISAMLLKQSTSRTALDRAIECGKLLISAPTITELKTVLQRKGFDKYITEQERASFLIALVRDGILVQITENINVCRDPKDNKFLDLAVQGAANCMVSGDNDLLALHPFQDIPIFSPRQFLDSVEEFLDLLV